jgi:molecular chaperone DnaK (HSP70)
MTLFGLDLNASRVRAVSGPLGGFPHTVLLDPPRPHLPLALSLQGRWPEVGAAGLLLCRQSPHLACVNFLPHLGDRGTQWIAGRHQLDASRALALVLQNLRAPCAAATGALLAIPAYLTLDQISELMALTRSAGLPVLGTIATPLAAALAAYAEEPWQGTAAVLDLDAHALTLTSVFVVEEQMEVLQTLALRQLGLRFWQARLLDALADCCIYQSRRDPRDSPGAEQSLFNQLEEVYEGYHQGKLIRLAIDSSQWYQNLVLQPQDAVAICDPLIDQTVTALHALLGDGGTSEAPGVAILTAEAGRMPGLALAVQDYLEESPVVILSVDSVARAAYTLAAPFQRGELPAGHLDSAAPLPAPERIDTNLPRLHNWGQDGTTG